jgi:integrase
MYSMDRSKFMDQTEVINLLSKLDQSRDSLLILLAIHTGARATELLNITKSDMYQDTATILIRGIKNSKDRELPLSRQLWNAVYMHAMTHNSDKVFPISYRRLEQIWRKYRVNNRKFHSLRHTFAIELYKKCRDPKLVQIALGHKSILNTMVYCEYIASTEELRIAMGVAL